LLLKSETNLQFEVFRLVLIILKVDLLKLNFACLKAKYLNELKFIYAQ
jgi:hypothetical protein